MGSVDECGMDVQRQEPKNKNINRTRRIYPSETMLKNNNKKKKMKLYIELMISKNIRESPIYI